MGFGDSNYEAFPKATDKLTEEAFYDMVEKIYHNKIAYQGIDPDQGIS